MNNKNQNTIIVYKAPSLTLSGFFKTSKNMIVDPNNFITEKKIEFLKKSAKNITIWDVKEMHLEKND